MPNQKKPLVFIPRPLSASTQRLLKDLKYAKYEVIQYPLISLSSIVAAVVPDHKHLSKYDEIVCVSSLAADIWVDNLGKENDYERANAFTDFPPIYVPGKTTAETIKGYGGRAIIPDGSGTPAIFNKMQEDNNDTLEGKKIKIICGEGGAQDLVKLLSSVGAYASALPLYEVLIEELNTKEWDKKMAGKPDIDYVWITSGSILKAMTKHFLQPWFKQLFDETKFITGSPRLEKMAKEAGLTNIICLANPENKTLLDYLTERN